jgi:hypothetical protein
MTDTLQHIRVEAKDFFEKKSNIDETTHHRCNVKVNNFNIDLNYLSMKSVDGFSKTVFFNSLLFSIIEKRTYRYTK